MIGMPVYHLHKIHVHSGRGVVHILNNSVPSRDHCGTPRLRFCGVDNTLLMCTCWTHPLSSEDIHLGKVLQMPKPVMLTSTQNSVIYRIKLCRQSKSTRKAKYPSHTTINTSLWTFKSSVSVLWLVHTLTVVALEVCFHPNELVVWKRQFAQEPLKWTTILI